MAMCGSLQQVWVNARLVGVKNGTPSGLFDNMEMTTDDFKIRGAANTLKGISPIWPQLINMHDRSKIKTRASNSRRPLPVFESSYGFRRTPVPFAPELDIRAVRLSEKVMPPSTSLFSPQTPAYDTSSLAALRRTEAQIEKLIASVNRELYGKSPEPWSPVTARASAVFEELDDSKNDGTESGEIIDDQPSRLVERQFGHKGNKRGAEDNPEKPAKRARHQRRPDVDMMSSEPRPGKAYYSGPYLERTRWTSQESYIPLKRLGTGGQGTAHLVKNRRSGSVVVCKVIPHTMHHRYSHSELFFLRDALPRHSRIINIRSALVSPYQTQLYLDYCDGGDLNSFIERYHYGLTEAYVPEAFIWHAFLQLTEALAFIHHGYDRNTPSSSSSSGGKPKVPEHWLPVIHRDIKPANILLQRARFHPDHPGLEPYPRLVLADFGLALHATELNTPPTSNCGVGTYAYQPPECPHHSTKGDVWAVGATVFELCTGKMPFDDQMPIWVTGPREFHQWLGGLGEEDREAMFLIDEEVYPGELEGCLGKALVLEKEGRVEAMELMRTVEGSEGRKEVRWEELHPWVFEGEGGEGEGELEY
ncbi:MAG: hypothetical protein LQ338_006607 [Usnochroma carphineum]|nr:MAG: hypothetical protein LQ338_006607 [Usnochroma carphineum]